MGFLGFSTLEALKLGFLGPGLLGLLALGVFRCSEDFVGLFWKKGSGH